MTVSEIDQTFISAAQNGSNDKVTAALKDGADIHAKQDYALRLAAGNGHLETLELLLDHGADIHANQDEAIYWAAQWGKLEAVRFLLDRGAYIHAENDRAISWSARNHIKKTALFLLRCGANPNAKDTEGKDAFEGTELGLWLSDLRQEVPEYFRPEKPAPKQGFVARWLRQEKQETAKPPKSDKPTREQCFTADTLHEHVLNACVTEQFTTLIGAPLVASTDKADRQLFQDIWDALPNHWQDQYQNIYMQFMKEGGVNPIVGAHTTAAQYDFGTSGQSIGR